MRAAKLLEGDVRFRIIGDGQERPQLDALVRELQVSNVELCGLLPVEEIPREIARASLCLGIFGTTQKAGRVVPNKVFECLAVGRPVLTGDTEAIRSAFDGEVATVSPGDPPALAAAIHELLGDEARLAALAAAGHARYLRDYSEAALSRALATYLSEAVAARRPASSARVRA